MALHRDAGTTLVLVTHDQQLAASMERVITSETAGSGPITHHLPHDESGDRLLRPFWFILAWRDGDLPGGILFIFSPVSHWASGR